jgi:hypothetical protein
MRCRHGGCPCGWWGWRGAHSGDEARGGVSGDGDRPERPIHGGALGGRGRRWRLTTMLQSVLPGLAHRRGSSSSCYNGWRCVGTVNFGGVGGRAARDGEWSEDIFLGEAMACATRAHLRDGGDGGRWQARKWVMGIVPVVSNGFVTVSVGSQLERSRLDARWRGENLSVAQDRATHRHQLGLHPTVLADLTPGFLDCLTTCTVNVLLYGGHLNTDGRLWPPSALGSASPSLPSSPSTSWTP